MLETIISKNFKLISKLGLNPFYEVFKAINTKNQTVVAIKIEMRSVSESKLYNEAKIIKEIQGEDTVTDCGIPQIIEMGSEDTYNYMMMNLLGPSLQTFMLNHGGKLQLKLVFNLGQQMIERIKYVHQRGYVHRDLRPDHFLYGRQKWPNKLYLSGFSMGKKYIRVDKKHASYRDNKLSFTGTARFSSVNTLLGIEQSRRDDLEAIIYILIYLMKGYLPWQGIKGYNRQEKIEKILMAKIVTPLEILCRDLPKDMVMILDYIRSLEYEEQPDYEDLCRQMNKMGKQARADLAVQ